MRSRSARARTRYNDARRFPRCEAASSIPSASEPLRVGERHRDPRADTLLARHADFPAEAIGEALDDREPDAVSTAAALIAAEERDERALQLLLAHARAGVVHDDAVGFDRHRDAAAVGVLAGVPDQVADQHAECARRRKKHELGALLAEDVHGLARAE